MVGKVTALEDKTVMAAPFPGAPNKVEYTVAVVKIADGIRGARLVTVPESGHLSALEQPRHVTEALLELLQA